MFWNLGCGSIDLELGVWFVLLSWLLIVVIGMYDVLGGKGRVCVGYVLSVVGV